MLQSEMRLNGRAMLVHAILAATVLSILLGCGSRPSEPTVEPVTAGKTVSVSSPTPTPEPTVSPVVEEVAVGVSVPDSPPEPIVMGLMDGGPDFIGLTSLEERIFHSGLIVRAKLRSIEGKAKRECRYSAGIHWIPVIEYEFDALEFLKGAGPESLSVKVSFGGVRVESQEVV